MTTTIQQPSVNPIQGRHYTPQEYLDLEKDADDKHEYRSGEIVVMAGGTTKHNEIAGNIYANLKFALRGQNHRVFISDVRLWIPEFQQYTYPDLMIIVGDPVYSGKGTSTVTNPIVIIEVLSSSTQDYDRGTKFTYYRSIPELKEYILVNQYRYEIEQFVKNESGKWVLSDERGENAVLSLTSVNLQICFSDIYEQVKLEDD